MNRRLWDSWKRETFINPGAFLEFYAVKMMSGGEVGCENILVVLGRDRMPTEF
jgi:hypothetical protein